MGQSGGRAVTAGTSLILDSHAFIWYVLASPRLSDKARQIMDDATRSDIPLVISAATLVELVYLVEKGTFMRTHLEAFHEVVDATGSGFEVAAIDNAVARAVSRIPRTAVTDPFDRIIAATALVRAARLVTYDRKIRQLAAVETIW
jgi:PIN domain nuclease of toxin-antitoxin system